MTKYILDIRRAFRFQQHPFKKFDHLEKKKQKKHCTYTKIYFLHTLKAHLYWRF